MAASAPIIPQIKQYRPDLTPEQLAGTTLCVQHSPRHIRIGAYNEEGFLFGEEFRCEDILDMRGGASKCQIEVLLKNHPLVSDLNVFREVRLLLQTGHFAWIPEALFNPDLGLDYLNLTASLDQRQHVACRSDLPGGIVSIFAFPKREIQFWQKKDFKSLRIYHHADVQHRLLPKLSAERPGKVLQLLLEEQWAGVMVSDGEAPLLANAVTFSTEEEISNFTRHVAEACQFDFLRDSVMLQGQIVRESTIYKRLFPYFAKLQFSPSLAGDESRGVFADLDSHRFFDLMALPAMD